MKKIFTLLTIACTFAISAQDEAPKLSISGSVDVYGTVNSVDGAGAPGVLIANPENANGFGLGMANTVFSYDGAKSGVVADIAFVQELMMLTWLVQLTSYTLITI